MLELSHKDFKAVMIKMLHETIKNTLETNVKIESLSKGTEDKKRDQTDLLELINTITEINSLVAGLKNRIRNEMGEITTDSTDINRTIKE